MEKQIIRNERTGEEYYKIKHPSGLTIFVWEMKGFSTTEALFGTKYGSINIRFKTENEDDFVDVPSGIAHFLEHKLFENEDTDVFDLYAKTGANANAYTSFDKTCYLFSTGDKYQEALEILLSFVQSPYFTKETVDKEMGIIGQEIRMYDDNPDWRVFFNLLDAIYVSHPVKIDIAGTVESISEIDAALLYRCYNTFYNLNNMVLSIAGNCKADEVLEIADKFLKKSSDIGLETAFPDEPETVNKKEVIQKLPVGTPIFNVGFKTKPVSGESAIRAEMTASIILSLLGGSTSPLYRQLFDDGLINSSFSTEVFSGDGYFVNIFGGDSKNPQEVFSKIKSEIDRAKKDGLDRDEFEIIKKSKYGKLIRGFNNVEACASLMLNSHFNGVEAFETIEALANISYEETMNGLNEMFDNDKASISIIEAN
ncbi:MAG: pitrilysin family protein [Oscillospiraceae bacterium]|jgi:predicted Zn-dependent peptidase